MVQVPSKLKKYFSFRGKHKHDILIKAFRVSRFWSNLVKLEELGNIYNDIVETLQGQFCELFMNSIVYNTMHAKSLHPIQE